MNPTFDLIVVHKPAEGDLQSMAFRFNNTNLPAESTYPISDIAEQTLSNAREKGLDPVRVVFMPYTYAIATTADKSKVASLIGDSYNAKCLWAAEGYSLDDTEICGGVDFDFKVIEPTDNKKKNETHKND